MTPSFEQQMHYQERMQRRAETDAQVDALRETWDAEIRAEQEMRYASRGASPPCSLFTAKKTSEQKQFYERERHSSSIPQFKEFNDRDFDRSLSSIPQFKEFNDRDFDRSHSSIPQFKEFNDRDFDRQMQALSTSFHSLSTMSFSEPVTVKV
jgi:hypothetical protein